MKDLIAAVVILLTMLSPFSDKTGVAYEAENAPIIILNHFPIYLITGEDSKGESRDYCDLAFILNQYDKLLFLHGHYHNDLGEDNFYNWWGVEELSAG